MGRRKRESASSIDITRYETRRVALRLSYDGAAYHGWQRQPGIPETIQGSLERALSALLRQEITVDGASRTDAGVHARDQLVAFTCQHPITLTGLLKAINTRLPHDIVARAPVEVPMDFQPRFVNRGKRYAYQLYSAPTADPLIDRYATHTRYPLNLEMMMEALDLLRGTHDFASFAASDGQHQTTTRTIYEVAGRREETSRYTLYTFHIAGSGFMKHMVRNIIGTIIEVGRGHWPISRVRDALAACDRRAAGPTAPARGLCLDEMFWSPDLLSPPTSAHLHQPSLINE